MLGSDWLFRLGGGTQKEHPPLGFDKRESAVPQAPPQMAPGATVCACAASLAQLSGGVAGFKTFWPSILGFCGTLLGTKWQS